MATMAVLIAVTAVDYWPIAGSSWASLRRVSLLIRFPSSWPFLCAAGQNDAAAVLLLVLSSCSS